MSSRSKSLRGLRIVSPDVEVEPQEENGLNHQPQQANTNERRYKKCGRTSMACVWNLSDGGKIFVEVYKWGVPCSKEGATLSSFLGTIATNGTLAPLNIPKWNDKEFEPFHRRMLNVVQERFMFPPETNKWVLQSINKKWRSYKSELKSQYYDTTKTREEIETNAPENVILSQWLTLVKSWFSEKNQKMSQMNAISAKQNKNVHTCGRKSFGRLRKEMEKELGYSPDRLSFYDATHKRKDGTYADETAKELMEKAFSLQSERSEVSNSNMKEINELIFQEVMGKEHNGRVRGLGLGPTPSSFFGVRAYNIGKRWKETSRQANSEVESLKEQVQMMSNKYDELSQQMLAMAELISNTVPRQQ